MTFVVIGALRVYLELNGVESTIYLLVSSTD